MFRSVLEGIAMTMKNHARAMCDEMGVPLTKMVVSGGGSNGDLFMQILSDVFGVPAHRNMVNGAAGLGAAICVALGLGVYKDRQDAVNHMVHKRDTFMHQKKNTELYHKINTQVYQQIVRTTDDLLIKSHQIFNPG